MTADGTQCSGLVDKVVSGKRWDLMVWEVFFNVNDSVILQILYSAAGPACLC